MRYPVKPTGHSGTGEALTRDMQLTDVPFLTKRRGDVVATRKNDRSVYRVEGGETQVLTWALTIDPDTLSLYYACAIIGVESQAGFARALEQRDLRTLASRFPADWLITNTRVFDSSQMLYVGDSRFVFTLEASASAGFEQVTSTRGWVTQAVALDDEPVFITRAVEWFNCARYRSPIEQAHQFLATQGQDVAYTDHSFPLIEASTQAFLATAGETATRYAYVGPRDGSGRTWMSVVTNVGIIDSAQVHRITARRFNTATPGVEEDTVLEDVSAINADVMPVASGVASDHKGSLVMLAGKKHISTGDPFDSRDGYVLRVSRNSGESWSEVPAPSIGARLLTLALNGVDQFVVAMKVTYLGAGKFAVTLPRVNVLFAVFAPSVFIYSLEDDSIDQKSWPADAWEDPLAEPDIVNTPDHIYQCFGPGCMYVPVSEDGVWRVLFTHDFGETWTLSGVLPTPVHPGGAPPMFCIVKRATVGDDGLEYPGDLRLYVPGGDEEGGSSVWVTNGLFESFAQRRGSTAMDITLISPGSIVGWYAVPVGTQQQPAHTHPGLPIGA